MENRPKSNSWNLMHLEYGISHVDALRIWILLWYVWNIMKTYCIYLLYLSHKHLSIIAAVHVNLLLVAVLSKANTADIVMQNDDMILNQLIVLLYSMCMTSVF